MEESQTKNQQVSEVGHFNFPHLKNIRPALASALDDILTAVW